MTNTDRAILDKAKTAIKYLRGYPDYDVLMGLVHVVEVLADENRRLGRELAVAGTRRGKDAKNR